MAADRREAAHDLRYQEEHTESPLPNDIKNEKDETDVSESKEDPKSYTAESGPPEVGPENRESDDDGRQDKNHQHIKRKTAFGTVKRKDKEYYN